ncbi:hypothetical protein Sgleb_06250 [Streptomyces glebosus]|uniref:Uncharacterized protein n=1 Tax=Streptomyces glebosus TaxID=249580 RepID=A0A640SNA7_9ACTN|nr:hypothetical protein [Streptomyces glebosus]GFE12578.1 hypothetical protein Sgleb_06250 [Streptomyces glebosus]GHG71393.1 hypothetical protein GCM10010513_43460 [Streptomyces glebosus]
MTIEDILQAEADEVGSVLADHDPEAFTRRLAERIAEAERQTPPPARPVPDGRHDRGPAPAHPGRARPLPRRPRPRPVPSATAGPEELRRHLHTLCESVLRGGHRGRLEKFARDYDAVGARTFACLLYSINRCDAAVFWWRFAAGAEDQLSAHCLAIHHAADDNLIDARLWRTIATALGYSPRRHLPNPAPGAPLPDPGWLLARSGPELQQFAEPQAPLSVGCAGR